MPRANTAGLKPDVQEALDRLRKLVADEGHSLQINSAYRSDEEQAKLYASRASNPYPVAPPGKSRHRLGTAVDMKVPGLAQEALAQMAQQAGFQWAGNKDRIHFDYKGAVDQVGAAVQGLPQRSGQFDDLVKKTASYDAPKAGQFDDLISKTASYDQPSAPAPAPQPNWFQSAGNSIATAPARAGKYVSDWWNLAAHSKDEQGNQVSLVDRVAGSVMSPLGDLLDLTAGGGAFANAVSPANPQGGWIKRAFLPALNSAMSAGGNLVGQAAAGKPTTNFEDIYQAARRGLYGIGGTNGWGEVSRQFPQLPDTAGVLAHGAENLVHDPNWSSAMNLAGSFAAGEFLGENVFKPVFKAGGATLRYLTDKGGTFGDYAASVAERKLGPAAGRRAQDASTLYKNLTNATPEFREGMARIRERQQLRSEVEQRTGRIGKIVQNLTRKMNAAGDRTAGDFLEGIPEYEGRTTPGNILEQAVQHGVEAGTEGAFFTHKDLVLKQAAEKFNVDPKLLDHLIEETRAIGEKTGQAMVDANLMDAKTFNESRGFWIRRFYQTNVSDPMQANALYTDLVERGKMDSTRANAILDRLQQTGESGPPEVVGTGLKTLSSRATQYQRKLLTPEERAAFVPDYTNLNGALGSMRGQAKAAGMHAALADIAANPALAMPNQLANSGLGKALDFTQTPRIKKLLGKTNEQVKKHQEWLSENLEVRYNQQHKWVSEQENTVGNVMQEVVEHQAKRPVAPVSPNEPGVPKAAAEKASKQYQQNLKDYNKMHADWSKRKAELQKAVDVWQANFDAGKGGGKDLAIKKAILGEHIANNPKDLYPGKAPTDTAAWKASEAASKKYVKDLASWRVSEDAWKKKQATLEEKAKGSNEELARRQAHLDKTTGEIDQWFNQSEKLTRRKQALEGAPVTDQHAEDALSGMEEMLGFQVTDPAERVRFYEAWKNTWTSKAIDIFDHDYHVDPATVKGIPQEVVNSVNGNILPAMALDGSLASRASRPGYTLWDSGGEMRYGAMEGMYGPEVLRRFIEDAIDPQRFNRSEGLVGDFLKWASGHLRASKLYYNPGNLYVGIPIQSFWEAKATVNAAGMSFDPITYFKSMREYKAWAEGRGPEVPVVKAMLGGVQEAGAGYMTATPKYEQPKIGNNPWLEQRKMNARQKFIEAQQFPKAGAAGVLIKGGMEPALAGKVAEVGFGARSGMGGIETHGVTQILEGLNKYGIALFTSYPVHSINRFLQLMATRPDVVMRYPILRNYLLQQSSDATRGRDERGEVSPSMIPIPGIKNERGEPLWIDVKNVIPFGGAIEGVTSPMSISGAYQSVMQKMAGSSQGGLAPESSRGAGVVAAWNQIAPPILGSQGQALMHAIEGTPSTGRNLETESVPMALARAATFPTKFPQDKTDVTYWANKQPLPGRDQFSKDYAADVSTGRSTPKDYTDALKKFDMVTLETSALPAARLALSRLKADRSIDDYEARGMIRNQMNWILGILGAIERQRGVVIRQQQEEMENEQAQQYSQESDPAYGLEGQGLPGQAF